MEESLVELKSAFVAWRSRKQHPREAVPAALLERARAAARHHGPAEVARATKVDRRRLRLAAGAKSASSGGEATATSAPAYSRLQMPTPAASLCLPFAEVETPTGMKVRLFADTGDVLGLLSTLLGAGDVR